jgi:hypothetical protein
MKRSCGSWCRAFPGWRYERRKGTCPLPPRSRRLRERVGPDPLAELSGRVAVPCAQLPAQGAWLAGRRLMAIDGAGLECAGTAVGREESSEWAMHFTKYFGTIFLIAGGIGCLVVAIHEVTKL